jgi:hypothetical protein
VGSTTIADLDLSATQLMELPKPVPSAASLSTNAFASTSENFQEAQRILIKVNYW